MGVVCLTACYLTHFRDKLDQPTKSAARRHTRLFNQISQEFFNARLHLLFQHCFKLEEQVQHLKPAHQQHGTATAFTIACWYILQTILTSTDQYSRLTGSQPRYC